MDRINNIINNEKYNYHLKKIKKSEKNREFCKHNMKHFLDVARIAYIMVLENGLEYDKDVVYAAALLHDIGKHEQYKNGIPHEKASADIAQVILDECGYDAIECKLIVDAILSHRCEEEDVDSMEYILYKADKLSRNCFCCKASKGCNWSEIKKNKEITS